MITDLIFLLPNNGTYTRDSRILRSKLTGPRISPSPPANAPEPQAPSRPPLRSTSHKIPRHQGLIRASTAETFNFPGILVSFGRANNSSDRKWTVCKQRQTLINYDAPFSRRINKRICTILQRAWAAPPVLTTARPNSIPVFLAQPFTAALPAAEPYVAGPNFRFQKLTRSCLR